jgi:hypothetical protein
MCNVAVMALIPMASHAQQPEARMKTALSQITHDLVRIAEMPGLHVPQGMQQNVSYMEDIFPRPKLVPTRYADVLDESANLIKRVADREIGTSDKPQLVLDVASNFEVMVNASKPDLIGAVSLAPITVRVTKGGQELKGWEIFYMEYFLKHVRRDVGPDSFPEPSTSTWKLPPGRYLFECRDQHGGSTEQRPV